MQIPFSNSDFLPLDRKYQFNNNGKNLNVITLGACSYVGIFVIDCCDYNRYIPNVLIGRFCSLGGNIKFFMGYNHEYKKNVTAFPFDVSSVVKKIQVAANVDKLNYTPQQKRYDNHFQNIIGNDVWIGNGVTIIGGVKIGTGAIIGTNSVIAKDIPPYAIAVGNPARVTKYRFDEETIKKFMAIKWWNWDIKKILENVPLMKDAEKFLSVHYPANGVRTPSNRGGGIANCQIPRRRQKNLFVCCRLSRSTAALEKSCRRLFKIYRKKFRAGNFSW